MFLGIGSTVFGFALWLGVYLISRNPHDLRLRLTGLGIIAYSFGLCLNVLTETAPMDTVSPLVQRGRLLILCLPALFWLWAMLHLLPENSPYRQWGIWWGRYGVLPTAIILAPWVEAPSTGEMPSLIYIVFIAVLEIPLLIMPWVLLRAYRASKIPPPYWLIILFALFFALSSGLLLLPLGWFSLEAMLILIGIDLIFLGFGVASADAFELGENLWRDMQRSLLLVTLITLFTAGQIAIGIVVSEDISSILVVLLFGSIGATVIFTTAFELLRRGVDRLMLRQSPMALQESVSLHGVAEAIMRRDVSRHVQTMEAQEFNRLVRNALRYLTDLPRLAANPLTQLPIVTDYLQTQQLRDDTLNRALSLKNILIDRIQRLKPETSEPFGITKEWRHFNVLYYPYVIGMKPYRAATIGQHAPETKMIHEWFLHEVPERTLYNWQSAAAKLIAQDLYQQTQSTPPQS